MPRPPMNRKVFQNLCIACLSLSVLIGGCIGPDFDFTSLSVQARGLSTDETITVTNGTSLTITGAGDSQWTEPQRFSKEYREDDTEYLVAITQQPTIQVNGNSEISNKSCRVLNPTGNAFLATNLVRIECGFALTISDTIDPITGEGTMTADNGLFVSNGLQVLSLNSSRSLRTGLEHLVVQDTSSSNPNDKALKIETIDVNGALEFEDLFLEGDPIRLSLSSTSQGCQINGSENDSLPDDSFLDTVYPEASTFQEMTQAIAKNLDWIASTDSFSDNRTCGQFKSGIVYFLDYDEEENIALDLSYNSRCYPIEPILISCGLALQITLTGISTDEGDRMEITAIRTDADSEEFTHIIELSDNTASQTFNLAFEEGDSYTLSTSLSATTPKTCEFELSTTDNSAGTFSSENIAEVLNCTTL